MEVENKTFFDEMLLKSLTSDVNETKDLLTLLLQRVKDTENGIRNIQEDVADVKKDTEQINAKLDVVLEKLNAIESTFSDLKRETRDIEQKLILMSSKLDKIEKEFDEEELEDYYILCQSLYNNWDELHELTRRLISVAEYLFSKLQKYNKPDYSPVILELCRALENEFLLKIFKKYTLDVIQRKGRSLSNFLATDKASDFLRNKTGVFIKAINKSVRTNKPEYTLGQMNTIMSLMNEEKVISASPLLQDFKDYLDSEIIANDLLNVQYIRKINDLVEKYRNPSAHPGLMSLDKATKCKEMMPDRIDYLIDCLL